MAKSNFTTDTRFTYKGIKFQVVTQIPPDAIVAKNTTTGQQQEFKVHELLKSKEFAFEDSATSSSPKQHQNILDAPEQDLAVAEEHLCAITPLLQNYSLKRVKKRSSETSYSERSLRRWIKEYKQDGREGLLPRSKGPKRKSKFDKITEEILQNGIEKWLKDKKYSRRRIYELIQLQAKQVGVTAPAYGTLCARIKAVPKRTKTRCREGKKAFDKEFLPTPGEFSNELDYPLQVVEIDHSPLDIKLVDEKYRKPVRGRVWITIALDVYSRSICGLWLSFDYPSSTSVAMVIQNMILLKDEICKQFEISSRWEMYGNPDWILVDNGKDLRSARVQRVCFDLGINIEFCPLKTPHYKGAIERVFGTLEEKVIHTLPGTTFSNVREKGEYDSEKEAILTLEELRKIIVTFIVERYQKETHSELGVSPNEKWEEGLELRGLPDYPRNPDEFTLALMEEHEGKVRRDGIEFNSITYWHESLSDRIGEKIKFRYDRRSLLYICILDSAAPNGFYSVKAKPRYEEIAKCSVYEIKKIREYERNSRTELSPEEKAQINERIQKTLDEAAQKSKKVRRLIEQHKGNKYAFRTSDVQNREKAKPEDSLEQLVKEAEKMEESEAAAETEELEIFETEVN